MIIESNFSFASKFSKFSGFLAKWRIRLSSLRFCHPKFHQQRKLRPRIAFRPRDLRPEATSWEPQQVHFRFRFRRLRLNRFGRDFQRRLEREISSEFSDSNSKSRKSISKAPRTRLTWYTLWIKTVVKCTLRSVTFGGSVLKSTRIGFEQICPPFKVEISTLNFEADSRFVKTCCVESRLTFASTHRRPFRKEFPYYVIYKKCTVNTSSEVTVIKYFSK